MSDVVTSLLENFAANRRDYGRQLAVLLEKDPESFQKAAVSYLSQDGNLPSEQIVVWLLQKAGMLLEILLNPRRCSLEEALVLARKVKENTERIDVHLARALKESSDEQSSRILRLLAEIADSNRTLPLLTGVLRGESSELRSKAARIFACHCQNTLFIQNALKDEDPSVRAAAIEGLGLAGRASGPAILLEAVHDRDYRVRANAALARYRLGDKSAAAGLSDMARHSDPEFRAVAVWALGETRDPQHVPTLEKLRQDPNEKVQSKATEALDKISASEAEKVAGTRRELSLETLFSFIDKAGRRFLYLSVTDADEAPVVELTPSNFAVEEDGVAVTGCQVQTPQNRPPLNLAFVLDCSGSITATEIQQMNSAVIRSLSCKRPKDRFAVFRFSMDVEKAVQLTDSPSRLTVVVKRLYRGLRTASRLHDAICEAIDALTPHEGCRAVLVIADGADHGSENNASVVVRKVKSSGVTLHIIEFGSVTETAALRELTQQTGGSFFSALDGRQLASACRTVVARFSSHYAVTYTHEGKPPQDIRLKVKSPLGCGETTRMPLSAEP